MKKHFPGSVILTERGCNGEVMEHDMKPEGNESC